MNKKNILTIFIIILGIFLSLSVVSASTIYVNPNGNDANDGMSESTSKATISNAIEKTDSNGIIYLSSGIYKDEGNYNISIDKNLTLKGMNSANKSIIDGENHKNLFIVNVGAVVTFENIIFTNAQHNRNGAAVANRGDSTFINCDFTNNFAIPNTDADASCSECGRGAGIYNEDGNITVIGCYFENNTGAMYGGAINNRYGEKVYIKDSIFINNVAYIGGGAFDTNCGKNVTILNSLFIGNNLNNPNGLIGNSGGAISNKESNLTVNYCVFYGNSDINGITIYNNAGITNADYNFWGINDNITNVIKGKNLTVNKYYKLIISPTVANNIVKVGGMLNYNIYFVLNTDGSTTGSNNLPSFNISTYYNGELLGKFNTKDTTMKSTKLLTNVSTLKVELNGQTLSTYQYITKNEVIISNNISNKKTVTTKTNKPDLKIAKITKKNNKYYIKIKNIGTATAKKNYLGVYIKNKLIGKKLVKAIKKGKYVIISLTIKKKYLKSLKKFKIDYKNKISEKNEKNNIVSRR